MKTKPKPSQVECAKAKVMEEAQENFLKKITTV